MAKMIITKALVELKLLDAKIRKVVRNPMVKLQVNSKEVQQALPIGDVKAFLQSKEALMARRTSLKLAIMLSNAKTRVSINGEKMTVLEAIERKATIAYDKINLEVMSRALLRASETTTDHNRASQRTLDTLLNSAAGSGTLDKATGEAITKNHNVLNEMTMVYGKKDLPAEIEKLDESISNFEAEVDYVLSASNALTTIGVD